MIVPSDCDTCTFPEIKVGDDQPPDGPLRQGMRVLAPCPQCGTPPVEADRLTEPHVLPADWDNGIHEVRTHHRIYKRHLWLVGSRTNP